MEEKTENIEMNKTESKTSETKNTIKKVLSRKSSKNEELEKLQKQNAELTDKVLRLSAEMQNMSRRHEQEKANIYKYDGEKLIKEILPIIDNFERAIALDDEDLTDDLSKFLSGFKMIYTSLLSTLQGIGVTEIEALGKPFDPTKMEAIMTANIMEEEQGVVLEVMQKGYMYNDKVIRVAMVKVNE